jgi:HlyD family secretion protein
LQVRVDARFEDIPKVSLNQLVEIDNPALSSPLIGKVLFVSSEADIQKNTLQVKVEISDPPAVLKPEMLVDVTFIAPEQIAGRDEPTTRVKLYVLKQLIQSGSEGSFVWLADQSEGVARKRPVETGSVSSNGLVEIVSGLSISSRIISSGIDGLNDGDRIQVTSEDPTLGTEAAIPLSSTSAKLNRLSLGMNR